MRKHSHKKRKDSHGPYCWYFHLNLKYLVWCYREYIKAAKNGGLCEKLLSENDFEDVLATFCCYNRGVTTGGGGGGGGRGPWTLRFSLQSKQSPAVLVSKIRDIAFYKGLEIIRTRISQFLPCSVQFLDNLWRLFIFSKYIREIDHFTLDLLKRANT